MSMLMTCWVRRLSIIEALEKSHVVPNVTKLRIYRSIHSATQLLLQAHCFVTVYTQARSHETAPYRSGENSEGR